MTNSVWPDGNQTQALLNRVREGEAEAVDKLLERHRDSLRHIVQMRLDRKIQRRVDVSDIVQDVLVEANRRLRDYLNNPCMAFHLWIRQIAKDRIIDAHRRHRVSAKRSIDREQPIFAPSNEQSTMDLIGQLFHPDLTPAANAMQREIAVQVELSIQELPETDRDMILMRHFEQLSNQEIAEALGITEPAASMRYLRAMRKLREIITQADTSGESRA